MRSLESKYGRATPPVVPHPDNMFELSVEQFASMFHTAALGVRTDRELVKFECDRVLNSGYTFQAFNIESTYIDYAGELLGDGLQLMVPISYPVGGQTLLKRMKDMEYTVAHRADQCCVTINFTAALTGRYDIIEQECRAMHSTFDPDLHIIDIVPATLFTAKELIEVCKAVQAGGGYHLKVNPGYGLGSTFEEIALIKRVFGDHFIIDPSGGIRSMHDVYEMYKRGCSVIHSQQTFVLIDKFREMKEKGERYDD